ncbi:SpoIIE family protein phosphatase [Spirilliplanes yamanashiensis]|uniref:histidine kinase n=1 Tax=Spirilliplanes yamanashiensis TaxID=42233 RepID=A0A8J4DH13_9ACTN|nr:SpoIIE family protein phosphatase [Spirilliplanes yamanashiensis]MDP9819654.1 signal transduction histidine kinase/serine phosphatase RsbU (regulator of sigma subunit)/DNA-binding NarL/FixJ family response regulator [Spirilliplanes yamanashiensis]GIJ01526.1 hypothetical protein Sya03_08780 [Spirilliplanes yamanashiensis]
MGAAPGDDLPPRLRTAFAHGGEMGRRMAAHDWSASPLGPPSAWPHELAGAVATMLASRAQVVLFWGPEYAALYNDAYIPTMGVKHPDFLGCPGADMWTEAWGVIQPLFDGVVRHNEAFWAANYPFMLERHGFLEETYFDVSYDPVRMGDGSVGGIFCIVSDTTHRVLGERRVATLSALGSRLAESGDQDELARRITEVFAANPADVPFCALYLDDGDRGPVRRVDAPRADDPALAAVEEVVRTGASGRAPAALFASPPPATSADEALVLPVGGGTGTVGAVVVGVSRLLAQDQAYRDFVDLAGAQISRAVTNLRAYRHERERAAALIALNQAKTNFFSNVSHEFRTPLTLILGPVEDALADAGLAEPQRERLATVHRNGLRLLKLVNTVLDFSRVESGRLHAEFRATDLADYTARLASTFRSAAERVGLRLTVDCPPLPAPVHVDREMWEKIVLNLLSNAVKHTLAGGIEVRVRAGDGAAVVTVRDTGVGIPADELPRLFDRFHRVQGAWSRSHEGTGIGLALVKELTELHGGTVGVESEPDRGSTFTVTVPFGHVHLPPESVVDGGSPIVEDVEPGLHAGEAHWWGDAGAGSVQVEEARPGDLTPTAAERSTVPRRGRILVADDNADLRDHVTRLLSPFWDVTAVADGQQAVAAALRQRYDLVLTDVMMPRLDGFGVVRALRADERTRELPIVMLSARAGEEASVEGLAAGADDYLVKPFSARDLLARVRSSLELGQLRGQTVRRLRGLVDAAAAVNTVRTIPEVVAVAAEHIQAMTGAGRVVVTAPGGRAERDGGAPPRAEPVAVLPLPDTSGGPLGELRVWSGAEGEPDRTLLAQLARLVGLRLENARLYETEHRVATTLQHSLLPAALPRLPGAVVAGRYVPGSNEAEVGGDWYDAVVTPADELLLVIGDVVGKGVHAAAGMGQLRNALRAYLLEGFDPGAALTRLNRLVDNLGRRQFATVVCVAFDPRTSRLRFAAAGHPSPVLAVPGEDGRFLYEQALGPPIGALADATYATGETVLEPGSRLLLYTDGLVEDRHRDIDTGLAELGVAAAKPTDHVEDLLDELLAATTGRDRRDDIALLALEATEPSQFSLRLPADPARLIVLRRRLEAFLGAHGVPDDDAFDLVVAISEAAANAIEHPVDPAEDTITVEVGIEGGAGGVVSASVRDSGRWRAEPATGFRGRGLALIGALADLTVERGETGTVVTLRRPLGA